MHSEWLGSVGLPLLAYKKYEKFSRFTAHSSYSQCIQNGWLICICPHFLAKSTRNLALSLHTLATPMHSEWLVNLHLPTLSCKKYEKFSPFTAHSSYSQCIQNGWLICICPHVLAKSTRHLALSLHTPATVNAFRMVG